MFKCNFCPLKYANKSNISRHERDKHFVEKGLIVYRCNECSFTAQMLSNLQKDVLHTHGQLGGVCDYCHLGFHSPKNLSAHLLATHGLPVMRAASADLATTSAAANAALGDVHAVDEDEINGTNLQKSESAFFGVHETYVIGGNQPMDENQPIDLLQFMQERKDEIQSLIIDRVAEGPRKVQFSANLGLVKPKVINDSSKTEHDERIHIYANSDMKPVMSLGLEDDEFFEMVEKMQAVLETFASYGSGWVCNT